MITVLQESSDKTFLNHVHKQSANKISFQITHYKGVQQDHQLQFLHLNLVKTLFFCFVFFFQSLIFKFSKIYFCSYRILLSILISSKPNFCYSSFSFSHKFSNLFKIFFYVSFSYYVCYFFIKFNKIMKRQTK